MRVVLALGLLIASLGIGGCSTVGQKQPGIANFDQVSDDMYRGAQPTDEGIRTLAKYNVRTVINLRNEADDASEEKAVEEAGMQYVRLPWDASKVTPADAEKFLQVLSEVPGPVFVHCYVGCDRTGLAVAAYRMRMQGWTADKAIKDMIAHGHYWALYPNVRATVAKLPTVGPTPLAPAMADVAVKNVMPEKTAVPAPAVVVPAAVVAPIAN